MDIISPHDRLRLATEARCSLATVESWVRGAHVSDLTALALSAAAAHLAIDTGRPAWPAPGWRGESPDAPSPEVA
jgi:hypothetical protein